MERRNEFGVTGCVRIDGRERVFHATGEAAEFLWNTPWGPRVRMHGRFAEDAAFRVDDAGKPEEFKNRGGSNRKGGRKVGAEADAP